MTRPAITADRPAFAGSPADIASRAKEIAKDPALRAARKRLRAIRDDAPKTVAQMLREIENTTKGRIMIEMMYCGKDFYAARHKVPFVCVPEKDGYGDGACPSCLRTHIAKLEAALADARAERDAGRRVAQEANRIIGEAANGREWDLGTLNDLVDEMSEIASHLSPAPSVPGGA
jgi:hypothetical protein